MPIPNQFRKEPYNMPSIEKDGHHWIRVVDHIELVSQAKKEAVEKEKYRIIDIINKYDDTRHNQEANETVRDIINLIKEDK